MHEVDIRMKKIFINTTRFGCNICLLFLFSKIQSSKLNLKSVFYHMSNMNLFKLLFVVLNCCGAELFFDTEVQLFRQNFRKFQRKSFKNVDRSFFEVYNALNNTIFEGLNQFENIFLSINETCTHFEKLNFEEDSKFFLGKICHDYTNLVRRMMFERENALMLFYPVDIDSFSSVALNKLFAILEFQHEEIYKVYTTNRYLLKCDYMQ